jgi:hypothetical protein
MARLGYCGNVRMPLGLTVAPLASSGSPIDSVVSTRLFGKQGVRGFTLLSKRNLKCAIPFDWNTGRQGFASSATSATSNFE